MFKRILPIFILFAGLTFLASNVQAQLNFFNGSVCTIQVKAAAEQNATPCAGPLCSSGTITIAPGASAVLPVPPCLTTTLGLGYRAVKFQMVGGINGVADKCTGPNPFTFVDCQNNLRQLTIFTPNFAAIF
jgi:hypothetical protein